MPEPAFVVVKGPQFKGLYQIIQYAPGRLELPVWDAPTFNLLSLDCLRDLPAVHDATRVCGVYFLWRGDELVYIGSSENMISRLKDHRKGRKIEFSGSTYLYVRSPWHLSVEALYIIAYRPEYNVKHTPKPMKRKAPK